MAARERPSTLCSLLNRRFSFFDCMFPESACESLPQDFLRSICVTVLDISYAHYHCAQRWRHTATAKSSFVERVCDRGHSRRSIVPTSNTRRVLSLRTAPRRTPNACRVRITRICRRVSSVPIGVSDTATITRSLPGVHELAMAVV
jgi:hypothetical protein